MPRLLIIGLDGATFDLLDPWIADGRLPGFARLLSWGAHGRLRSTLPAMTFPAWTTFMTGKNPGKHGVFDFTERQPGAYGIRFVNANWVKAPTLWRMLSDAGKRVAVLSLPVTYPPEPVNGVMISGFDAPGMSRGAADARSMYPPSLHQELVEQVGGYVITANAVALAGRPEQALGAILATIEQKIRCARYLYRKEPWDVFLLLLGETDSTAHHFWKYQDPTSPLHAGPRSPACRDALLSVYQRADALLDEWLAEPWPDTTTVVVSDHGVGGASDMAVCLNLWLAQEGFLRYAAGAARPGLGTAASGARRLVAHGLERLKQVAVKTVPPGVKAWILRTRPGMVGQVESFLRFGDIDWAGTTAFADENPYYPQIWLNVRGREPQGLVAPGDEYEATRTRIVERLHAWRDPELGTPVVQRAYRREELYHGPHVDRSPDIVIDWNLRHGYSYVPRRSRPGSDVAPLRRLSAEERRTVKSGSHRDHGVLALHGEAIRAGTRVDGAGIADVAPTLLYLLDLPVPADMDGAVLEAAISEEVLRARPVRRAGAAPDETARREGDYSDEEAAVIEERLRGLGYVE